MFAVSSAELGKHDSEAQRLMAWVAVQGSPCVSIQWGAWAGGGMAGGAPDLQQRLARSGLRLVTPVLGLAAMGDPDYSNCFSF